MCTALNKYAKIFTPSIDLSINFYTFLSTSENGRFGLRSHDAGTLSIDSVETGEKFDGRKD